jgi:hypothetical protein
MFMNMDFIQKILKTLEYYKNAVLIFFNFNFFNFDFNFVIEDRLWH